MKRREESVRFSSNTAFVLVEEGETNVKGGLGVRKVPRRAGQAGAQLCVNDTRREEKGTGPRGVAA